MLFPRKFFLGLAIVDEHDAADEVGQDQSPKQVEGEEEDLNVLVGIVLGGVALPIQIHHSGHL